MVLVDGRLPLGKLFRQMEKVETVGSNDNQSAPLLQIPGAGIEKQARIGQVLDQIAGKNDVKLDRKIKVLGIGFLVMVKRLDHCPVKIQIQSVNFRCPVLQGIMHPVFVVNPDALAPKTYV